VGRGVKRARSRRSGSSIPSSPFRVADVDEHAADRGAVPRIRLDQPPRAMRARQPARRRVDRRRLLRREKGTTCLPAIDAHGLVVPCVRPDDERREYRERRHRALDQPRHPGRTISRPARDDMRATLRPLGVSDMLALAHPGPRGCRTRANDGSTRVYRGWEDAYPGALVEIREPSLAAPVTAAVVGVVPGAALPALPGGFRDAPEASAGPGGGVPALDSDGRRLGGAPLRETGRDRLLGGRHVNSDADDGGMPAIAGRRRATREMSRMRNVTLRSWKMRALPPQLVLEKPFEILMPLN